MNTVLVNRYFYILLAAIFCDVPRSADRKMARAHPSRKNNHLDRLLQQLHKPHCLRLDKQGFPQSLRGHSQVNL